MRQEHQSEPEDNAKTGPTVGKHVLAIGFEDEGICAAAGADQVVAEACVQDAGDQDQHNAQAKVLELQPGHPLANRLEKNRDGGHDDQCAFKSRGKECDALVAVEEVVRRLDVR